MTAYSLSLVMWQWQSRSVQGPSGYLGAGAAKVDCLLKETEVLVIKEFLRYSFVFSLLIGSGAGGGGGGG